MRSFFSSLSKHVTLILLKSFSCHARLDDENTAYFELEVMINAQ